MKKVVYSVAEAAKILGLSRNSMYEAIRRKELYSCKFGRRIVIPIAALEQLLTPQAEALRKDRGV